MLFNFLLTVFSVLTLSLEIILNLSFEVGVSGVLFKTIYCLTPYKNKKKEKDETKLIQDLCAVCLGLPYV